MELRPYQTEAVNNLRLAMAQGFRRVILSSPTGSGKTEIGFEIIRKAQEKGKRVAFLANRIHLVDQTCRRLAEAGFSYGVIQGANTTAPWRSILVCSIQTVVKRGLPECDLLVIDECHAAGGTKGYQDIMDGKPVIGLTATPYSPGLGKHIDRLEGPLFQHMVTAARIKDLIRDGYLVSAEVWAPGEPDLSSVRVVAGDYDQKQLDEAVDKPELVGDIVTHWLKLAGGASTVVFATNISHSKHICAEFNACGVKAEHLDCYTDDSERVAILERVSSGETTVICNVGVLAEGWDFPACKVLILARPTKSLIRYLQMAGRVLRPFPGKDCLIRGTKILTDKGEIEIQNITLDHKVWDGYNFVRHMGAVCKGIRPVIVHDGITATPDHEVMTDDGWKRIEEAYRRNLRIVRTGMGGSPIRVSSDCFEAGGRIELENQGQGCMPRMLAHTYGNSEQHTEASRHEGLPALQPKAESPRPALAVLQMPDAGTAMYKHIKLGVQKLRGTRHPILFREPLACCKLDCREPGLSRPDDAIGPHRQQWKLRARKFEMVRAYPELREHPENDRGENQVHRVQREIPSDHVFGRDSFQTCPSDDGSGDSREVGETFLQAEGEVWDIYETGPLHRFTANGRLVHNCALILDHSGVVIRLGFPWDDFSRPLDDGKARTSRSEKTEKPEPLPKKCPQCSLVKPPRTPVCPECGFEAVKPCDVEVTDGDLVLLTDKTDSRAIRTLKDLGRQSVYSQLLSFARAHKYASGWAKHKYREVWGQWPNHQVEIEETPTPEMLAWIRSQQIRYVKGKARGKNS